MKVSDLLSNTKLKDLASEIKSLKELEEVLQYTHASPVINTAIYNVKEEIRNLVNDIEEEKIDEIREQSF